MSRTDAIVLLQPVPIACNRDRECRARTLNHFVLSRLTLRTRPFPSFACRGER